MKTIEEAKQRSKEFLNMFLEVRKNFPEVKLNKNGDEENYQIFFIGNKVVGTDYELSTWEKVPILSCNIERFAEQHPTRPLEYYLSLKLNYRGYSSSEDYLMSDFEYYAQCKIALEKASKDFLTTNV